MSEYNSTARCQIIAPSSNSLLITNIFCSEIYDRAEICFIIQDGTYRQIVREIIYPIIELIVLPLNNSHQTHWAENITFLNNNRGMFNNNWKFDYRYE